MDGVGTPRVHDRQNASQRVPSDRDRAFFAVEVVPDRDGELIFQNRDGVGELDPMLALIGLQPSADPIPCPLLCTIVHHSHMTIRSGSRGSIEVRLRFLSLMAKASLSSAIA